MVSLDKAYYFNKSVYPYIYWLITAIINTFVLYEKYFNSDFIFVLQMILYLHLIIACIIGCIFKDDTTYHSVILEILLFRYKIKTNSQKTKILFDYYNNNRVDNCICDERTGCFDTNMTLTMQLQANLIEIKRKEHNKYKCLCDEIKNNNYCEYRNIIGL